jgi:hypothetical protein
MGEIMACVGWWFVEAVMMDVDRDPVTAMGAYQAIVDQLVEETSHGVAERLVREEGIYSKAPGEAAANRWVQSLSAGQRGMLAEMLHQQRVGAIHDVLAVLTWWMLCRGVRLTFRGEAMPFELSGMGIHGDYVGRRNGWEWPEETKT